MREAEMEAEVKLVCRGTDDLERSIASELAIADPVDAYSAIVSYVMPEEIVPDVTIA